jgi:hypothetical protein
MSIDVGKEFSERLTNRHKYQGDGVNTADEFRNKYLSDFDKKEEWDSGEKEIILDFANVRKIGPSFANEAFAYFMKFTDPTTFKNRIKFINTTKVQMMIITEELEAGYMQR